MAAVRGSFAELFHGLPKHIEKVTGISEMQMGQVNGHYKALQDAMNQQMQKWAEQYVNTGKYHGLLGQLGAHGFRSPEQYVNNPFLNAPEPTYPGKVVQYPEGYRKAFLHDREIQELAIIHDFEYKFDSDSFVHKNGGFVSRRQIEDSRYSLEQLFIKARTPNISWLDDRIEEMRVKLV